MNTEHPILPEIIQGLKWFLQLTAIEWKRAFLCLCISSFLTLMSLLFQLEEKMFEFIGVVVVMTIPLVIASHVIDLLLHNHLKPELPTQEVASEQAN